MNGLTYWNNFLRDVQKARTRWLSTPRKAFLYLGSSELNLEKGQKLNELLNEFDLADVFVSDIRNADVMLVLDYRGAPTRHCFVVYVADSADLEAEMIARCNGWLGPLYVDKRSSDCSKLLYRVFFDKSLV